MLKIFITNFKEIIFSLMNRKHCQPFKVISKNFNTMPEPFLWKQTWTAFTGCRHILKTMKNVTVAKFELAFTRCRNNLKTVGNLLVKSSLQDFDAEELYLNPKNRSVSFQTRLKMFYFHHFKVLTRCRFQNVPIRVPFSNSTVFKICRQKMRRFRVNRRPIRRIFHRF